MKKKFLIRFLASIPIIAIIGLCIWDHIKSNTYKFIYYEYNDTMITRIDINKTEARFYYGKYFTKKELPENYISCYYWGRDRFMDIILWFRDKDTVQVTSIGGRFPKQHGQSSGNLFIKDYLAKPNSATEFEKDFPSRTNLKNAIRVSEGIEHEKVINNKNHSLVKAIYRDY